MRSNALVAGLAVAAVALAGCTGQFDVQQTEPLRIQLEGSGQRAELPEGGQREFVVVKPAATERMRVDVTATSTSRSDPTVVVIVRDRDSGQELDRERLEVRNNTPSTGSLDVDVRGKDNVVVITQVTGGSAVVNVAARQGTATQAPAPGTGSGQDDGAGAGPGTGGPDAGPHAPGAPGGNATAGTGGNATGTAP